MSTVINTNISSPTKPPTASQIFNEYLMQAIRNKFRISTQDNLQLSVNSKVAQLQTASRFYQDTITVLQTAESGLSLTRSLLDLMRELAVMSSDGIYSDMDRSEIQKEFTDHTEHITRIAEQSTFNGYKVLDGSLELVTQTGGQNRSIKIADMGSEALGLSGLSVLSKEDAQNAVTKINEAIVKVYEQRRAIGAEQNLVSYLSNNVQTSLGEGISGGLRIRDIRDVNFTAEFEIFKEQVLLKQAGIAQLAQANSLPANILSLLR